MKKKIQQAVLLFLTATVFNLSCQKEKINSSVNENESAEQISSSLQGQGHLKQTKTFPSDVVRSWINMQLLMFKLPAPAGSPGSDRAQAYSGITLYEAVMPGMPAYQTLTGQLTAFPEMPGTEPGKAYHWAASANAALAQISRKLFSTTAAANQTTINNLEATLLASYANEADAATLHRSVAFGKEVADRVAKWADSDGWKNVNPPYIPPVGFGIWVLTNPAAPAANPYAYQRRLTVPGSTTGSTPAPLPPFSTDPSSAFYAMVKEVYDARNAITPEQKAMADYFKDFGYVPGSGFVWILQEALRTAHPMLDQAAVTYAKVGMAQNDATIALFTDKYKFLTMRPVTYIRAYINPTWSTYIPTPNHPEFPSGHATTNGAVLEMMRNVFGDHFPMTLHVNDFYPSRPYETFTQMGLEMADSRFYSGLHYKETCVKSIAQGKKVAQNILSTIKFLKE